MFNWEFKTKKEKSASWYSKALVISVAFVIWWIFTGLYMMSIVVIIAFWVYMLIENNSPDIIKIEIDDNWILVWDNFYDYPKIESFWIIYNKNIPVYLRLRLNTKGFKILDIVLDKNLNTSQIRAFLLQYISEDEKNELSSMDKIVDYLKL